MRRLTQILILTVIALAGCIGTDIEDPQGEQISFNIPSDAVFRVNWGIDLNAEFRGEDGNVDTTVDFVFTSSDPSVLEIVGSQGVGRSQGTATVTATVAGDNNSTVVGELEVTVEESREAVIITNAPAELGIGQQFVLNINYIDPKGDATTTTVEWSSTDPSIATVSASGEITGVSVGEVEIIVTAGFGEDRITLNVNEDAVVFEPEVNITTFKSIFAVGTSSTFEATLTDDAGVIVEDAEITWSSSDESIATVDGQGVVSAISPGNANIIATSGNVSGFVEITVEGQEVMIRSGSLRGIRGYRYSGSLTLSVNDAGDLILNLENVSLDSRAPGPYWYLSNQETGINGGIRLGASTGGSSEINISEMFPGTEINTFENFVIWCEPFNIPLGVGVFEE